MIKTKQNRKPKGEKKKICNLKNCYNFQLRGLTICTFLKGVLEPPKRSLIYFNEIKMISMFTKLNILNLQQVTKFLNKIKWQNLNN